MTIYNQKSLMATIFSSFAALSIAQAASLQVQPVLIDVDTDKGAASTVTLKNSSDKPLNAQVRIFKWHQAGGKDHYEETNEVVVSPPLTTLSPNGSQVLRVVRVAKTKPIGEEAYRLVVDELPESNQKKGTIALLVRHAVPVFFASPQATQPKITWGLVRMNGKLSLKAVNEGDRRLRLANVNGRASQGSVDFGKGLVGYILGHSTMNFAAKATMGSLSGEVSLKAETHMEPVNVTLFVQ